MADEKFVEQISEEIKKFGDNIVKIKDDQMKMYSSFKEELDKNSKDVLGKVKEEKLGLDVLVKQELMDNIVGAKKAFDERMDKLEIAFKRPGGSVDTKDGNVYAEAKQFYIEALAAKSQDGGATYDRVKNLNIDVEGFKKYVDNFDTYLRKGDKMMIAEEMKALSVGSDPDGGYTVTPAMSARIIQKMFETDPVRQLCATETISTGALEMLVDWGEFGFGWEGETVAGATTDTSEFGKKRIPVHVMYAKPKATQTLIEDSGINIENWLSDKLANKFSRGEANAFVLGDGIGKPRGFLTYADGSTFGTVEQVHMGAAAAITADGFFNVKYALNEFYLNSNGLAWLMARSTVLATMKLKDGLGNYLWSTGFQAGQPANIIGIPVRMATSMPAIAANALSVALADWKEAYLIVDRLGITVQRDPYTKKPFIEFYSRKRVGGDIVNYDAIKIGTIAA